MNEKEATHSDYLFMTEALTLAKQAAAQNEVPIGAIVVDVNGTIIGRGSNKVEQQKSQVAHAEIEAIAQATAMSNDWRLDGCTIYITIEPCSMCFSLIKLSRLKKVVFGAPSPRFGYQLDKVATGAVYKNDVVICSGIYADAARKLIRQFFQKQRKKKVSTKSRDLAKIKQSLIDRRQKFEAQLQKLSTEKITDDQVQDAGDQALTSTMENLRNSLQDTELREYNRIVQALDKIEDGTYGICIDCGEEISQKRLSSYPNAGRSLACQEVFEDKIS